MYQNTYVSDGTYVSAFGTGTGGNGTYTTAPSNTSVAIEPMQTGNWLPYHLSVEECCHRV